MIYGVVYDEPAVVRPLKGMQTSWLGRILDVVVGYGIQKVCSSKSALYIAVKGDTGIAFMKALQQRCRNIVVYEDDSVLGLPDEFFHQDESIEHLSVEEYD